MKTYSNKIEQEAIPANGIEEREPTSQLDSSAQLSKLPGSSKLPQVTSGTRLQEGEQFTGSKLSESSSGWSRHSLAGSIDIDTGAGILGMEQQGAQAPLQSYSALYQMLHFGGIVGANKLFYESAQLKDRFGAQDANKLEPMTTNQGDSTYEQVLHDDVNLYAQWPHRKLGPNCEQECTWPDMTYEQTDPNAGHIIQPTCSVVCPSDYQVNYYVTLVVGGSQWCPNTNTGSSFNVIQSIDQTTGDITVDNTIAFIPGSYTYQIIVETLCIFGMNCNQGAPDGYFCHNVMITLTAPNCLNYVIQPPAISTVQIQKYVIPANDAAWLAIFTMQKAGVSPSITLCPLTYSIELAGWYTWPALTITEYASYFEYNSGSASPADFPIRFRVKATITGTTVSQTYPDSLNYYELSVCNNLITISTVYPDTLLGQVQYVEANSVEKTLFYLPQINSPCSGIADISPAVATTIAVSNVNLSYENRNGQDVIVPLDITLETSYTFTIQVSDNYGNIVTSAVTYELHTGCPTIASSSLLLNMDDTVLGPVTYLLSPAGEIVYDVKFTAIINSLNYICKITSMAIVGTPNYLINNIVPAVLEPVTHTTTFDYLTCIPSSCGSIKFTNIQHPTTITFTIQFDIGGQANPIVLSQQTAVITLDVICAPGIQPSKNILIDKDLYFPLATQVTNATISFEKFVCNPHQCCNYQNYSVVYSASNLEVSPNIVECCTQDLIEQKELTFTVNNLNEVYIYVKILAFSQTNEVFLSDEFRIVVMNFTEPVFTVPIVNITEEIPEFIEVKQEQEERVQVVPVPRNETKNITIPKELFDTLNTKYEVKKLDNSDQRQPIEIFFEEMNTIGEIHLLFSENLKSIDQLESLNLTSISNDVVFRINYQTNVIYDQDLQMGQDPSDLNQDNNDIPTLSSWVVQNFTNDEIIFKLDFKNKLSVSSTQPLDKLELLIQRPGIFQSTQDGTQLQSKQTFYINVPRQMASEDEFNQIQSMGENSQGILLFSLLLPIVIKMCFRVGIVFDIVWDLFNMLQIVTNIRNIIMSDRLIHGMISAPASVTVLAEVLNSIVYFKPFENDLIKEYFQWIESLKAVIEWVNQIGILIVGILVTVVVVPLLFLIRNLSKKVELVQKVIKVVINSIIWGAPIRMLLQGYFQMTITSWYLFRTYDQTPPEQRYVSIVMIAIAFSTPIVAWFFININLERFKEKEFTVKYGTFYQSQRVFSKKTTTHFWYTFLFLFRRFTVAYFTVMLFDQTLYQCWAFIGTCLISTCFTAANRPFENGILNKINLLNEITALLGSYLVISLTNVIPDLEFLEDVGWYYIYLIGASRLSNRFSGLRDPTVPCTQP